MEAFIEVIVIAAIVIKFVGPVALGIIWGWHLAD